MRKKVIERWFLLVLFLVFVFLQSGRPRLRGQAQGGIETGHPLEYFCGLARSCDYRYSGICLPDACISFMTHW